jgi:hypothetical protein
MKKAGFVPIVAIAFGFSAAAQTTDDANFKLALPEHRGQLIWSADGFKIIQSSAKPNGRELGIRGKNESGRLTFLGFLFLFPDQAPLTSASCRDGVMSPEKKSDAHLKILATLDSTRPGGPPVSLVSYTTRGDNSKAAYMVRGFTGSGDICGDLEFYSDTPISADDAALKQAFASYRLDENYSPQFNDAFVYAQTLYQARMYKAAAPIFEIALAKLRENPDTATIRDAKTTKRVVTDQEGIAYGMAGDIQNARRLFEKAIAEDPDYPMYYYNLACADAEDKNLAGAREHLQQAFARKANVISGETMPDPTRDDSFLPYRDNKAFWTFLKSLRP